MSRCLIGLGSNLGDRRAILDDAIAKLRSHPRIEVSAVSSFRETSPIGGPADQPSFLNAAAVLDTSYDPLELLALLQQVEIEAGRQRNSHWGPRTLDLDLLLFDELTISTPTLILPHPRMAWRRFVLEPAAEVAGEMLHPVVGWTVARLLEHLNTAVPYVAVAGAIAAGKTNFARLLCEKTHARLLSESFDEKSLEIFYADPSAHAWETELDFLRQRTELLAKALPDRALRRLTISDFWFDQSVAFARVWLKESEFHAFSTRWQEAREKVVKPKLLIVLDAPAEALIDRVRNRGRRGEHFLTLEQLRHIRQSILDQALWPEQGPVLKIESNNSESAILEALAAIAAMI